MTKTKIISVAMSLLAAASLAACGDSKKSTPAASNVEQARQFLISNVQAYAQGNAAQFCKESVSFIAVDAKGNLEQLPDSLSKLLADETKGCLDSAKTDPYPKTAQDKVAALKGAAKAVAELKTAQVVISPDGKVATVKIQAADIGFPVQVGSLKVRAFDINGTWYRDLGPGLN